MSDDMELEFLEFPSNPHIRHTYWPEKVVNDLRARLAAHDAEIARLRVVEAEARAEKTAAENYAESISTQCLRAEKQRDEAREALRTLVDHITMYDYEEERFIEVPRGPLDDATKLVIRWFGVGDRPL